MTDVDRLEVTLDEAVSLLVNLDYVPEPFTVREMTGAFLSEAEADLENARGLGDAHSGHIELLRSRYQACKSRHALVEALYESLALAIRTGAIPRASQTATPAGVQRYNVNHISDWTSDRMGLWLPQHAAQRLLRPALPADADWRDITIVIRKNLSLKWQYKQSPWRLAPSMSHRLLGRTERKAATAEGNFLLAIARGERVPSSGGKTAAVTMSRLRGILKQVTGLKSDPFYPFNKGDRWKPRFNLRHSELLADVRAKIEGERKTISYDDNEGVDVDDANEWGE